MEISKKGKGGQKICQYLALPDIKDADTKEGN